MILVFKFNYISQNSFLQNILEVTCKDFDIKHSIKREQNIITLHVEDTQERLSEFSDEISVKLPLSLFLKSTAVEVVESMPQDSEEIPSLDISFPFLPKILMQNRDKSSQNYLNPLLNNEVGKASFNANSITLNSLTANDSKSFEELYETVSDLIANGEEVHVDSISGSYVIGKLDEKSDLKGDFIVTPTDLSLVEKMVVIRDNEIKALASLEKPIIKLKVNSIYEAKNILPSNRVKLQLSDELLLLNICDKLHVKGIDFIYKKENSTCKHKLVINGEFQRVPKLEVTVLENGEILIVNGDEYSSKSLKETLKKFDKTSHAQFASLMQEHNLFEKNVSCFYMSKKHDDSLMFLSKEDGMLDLVNFPIIESFEEIFNQIKSSDNGESLITNYKKSFPQFYENTLTCSIPNNNNIYTIWGIVAVILGISKSVEEGSQKVLDLAESFGGEKGPSIDYLLKDNNSIKSDFDMMKLVKSIISFKLAKTDDIILSYGLLESFAFFLSDFVDSINENYQNENTLLCGLLFGERRFSELTCKNVVPNSTIFMNRELPIDC